MLDPFVRYFLGPDVFISYARDDAYEYAGRLASMLEGLFVCLDQAGSPPGRVVPPRVLRQARRSTAMVVIGSPEGLRSLNVEKEVAAFPSDRRPLIPVVFQRKREGVDLPWGIAGLAVARESGTALRESTPSLRLVARIRLAVGNQTQSQKLRKAGMTVGVLVAAGLLVLGYVLLQLRSAAKDLDAAQEELVNVSSLLTETEEGLTSTRDKLAATQNDLKDLQVAARKQEQRLARAVDLADREERRANDQEIATVQLWEELDQGMQESYPQPDLSCQTPLTLDPPLNIYFHFSGSELTERSRHLLAQFATCYLKQELDFRINIVGYSSDHTRQEEADQGLARQVVGYSPNELYLALADRRANAVRDYLDSVSFPGEIRPLVRYGEERERQKFLIPLMNNRAEITFHRD